MFHFNKTNNMKAVKYICIIISAIVSTSCSDILDKRNLGAINEIWNDPAYLETYVNNLYNDVPGWNYEIMDNSTDEGRCIYPGNPSNSVIMKGLISPTNSPFGYWKYDLVRKCNEFLIEIETSTIENKEKMTAEVRFLRAFQYFEMVKRYGGIPLITKPQSLDDDLFVSRNTIDECFKFIIDEFDAAAKLFESQDIITTTNGRASKGAALAMKAKAYLYYASPLFNASNDLERWKKTAETAKEVMGLNYELYPDFVNIHQHQTNSEIIFKKEYKRPTRTHGRHDYVNPLSISVGDVGYCHPVQELVDAFPMKNGKHVTDPTSGYDPNNPYINRDARFYATILYNEGTGYGRTQYTYLGFPIDGMGADRGTSTGYYCIKAVNHELKDFNYGYGDETCFIHMRLADIYLMYAEATNEYLDTPDESVYTTLEKIRERAKCDPVQIPRGMTKDEMRKFIHNERYIEFAFEQVRCWDLRRWKTAVDVLNGKKLHGMAIEKNDDGSFIYGNLVEVDANPIVFKDHMYLNPIPYSSTVANPNLDQNPGY
jgi:hypothetical protein